MIFIPEKYYHFFEDVGYRRTYFEGESVYLKEDESKYIYLIESGKVKATIPTLEGESITLELLKKGQLFGDSAFVDKSVRPVSIEIIEASTLVVLEVKKLFELLKKNEDLLVIVLKYMTESHNQLVHSIYRLRHYNQMQKIVDFLLLEKNEDNKVYASHNLIAECTNMHRVSVTRTLNKLKKMNLIELHYGIVKLIDIDHLLSILDN